MTDSFYNHSNTLSKFCSFKPMKIIIYFSVFIHLCLFANAQLTSFEKSNGKKTATYFEIVDWYKNLAETSSKINIMEMGPTDAGYPLQLVLVSADGRFDTAGWRKKGKIIILINNGIHPGEPDGIDASMMVVRDIIKNKIKLPLNVVLAVIPVYNIGGCLNRNSYTRANQNGPEEYGFRGNSQNLDLNRDFTKCDSKEAKTFTKLFHFLSPDIFIDNHVSDGADFQHTMTLISTQYDKLGPVLGNWLKNDFEPSIYTGMKLKGWDLIPYVDFENNDLEKGINMFFDPPRYSSGYAALFNTLSFIPETHMLKPYEQRVRSTYDLMVTFIETGSRSASDIIAKRKYAKDELLKQEKFPLSWKMDSSRLTTIQFKGYEKDQAPSDATGLNKMIFNHDKPFTKEVKFMNAFKPQKTVAAPRAYIIPQGWHSVIDLLKLNQVIVNKVQRDTLYNLTTYHIDEYKSFPKPYEKHHKNYAVSVSASVQPTRVLKGDHIIYLNQPGKRYIIEMLEPTGDDSFFAWNFFDAILQQKEGYSDYRWEDIAATELKNDPILREKLDAKKAADPKFASNSAEILNFIYRNSRFYEKAHLRYPVYRLDN